MKRIKIFLASSIKEFADARHNLKDFNRCLNNELIDNGIYLSMFMCEYSDNDMVHEGSKQDQYCKEIDDTDIFLLLTGNRLGVHTLEEYEYALRVRDKRKTLKFLIAFKCLDSVDETVKVFTQRITSENVSSITFEKLSDVKVALAKTIAEILGNAAEICISDGCVVVNGKWAVKLAKGGD